MLEFARIQWLWLLTLCVVLYAAWLLARRFRPTRVTYGQVWHTVARKLRPPGWRRLLRTALTLLIAALILGSTVFYAAGLQRAAADQPAPLLIAITIDCTVSMAATDGNNSRQAHTERRAQEILDALGENDRAVVYRFTQGRPVGSRWLKRGQRVEAARAIDFAQPDLAALAESVRALGTPPELAAVPAPLTLVYWLGDDPPALPVTAAPPRLAALGSSWRDLSGLPMAVESSGAGATNDAVTSLRYTPATEVSPALLEASSRGGKPLALAQADGKLLGVGTRFELLPTQLGELSISTQSADALALDDAVRFTLPSAALRNVSVLFPAADGEPNFFLGRALGILLPGREIKTDGTQPGEDGLLVLDRFALENPTCRAAICFAALPEKWGRVAAPVAVKTGFQRAAPTSADFELPDLSLLAADRAWPVVESQLRPLLLDPMGNVLIAEGTIDGTRVLYCGFVPHLSTLVNDQGDLSGMLLLLRWLAAVQTPKTSGLPPVLNPGQIANLRLEPNQTFRVEPLDRADTAFSMTSGPDGRATLGPIPTPGLWRIVGQSGQEVGTFSSLWTDDREQSLPFTALPRADLAALNPQLAPDWRDSLPGLLIVLALALVLLEWILWLVGATE